MGSAGLAAGPTADTGCLLSVTRGTGLEVRYAYDALGRPTLRQVEHASGGYSVGMASTYDRTGALVGSTLPGGARQSVDYDAFHRRYVPA